MAICWLAEYSAIGSNNRHVYSEASAGRTFQTMIVHIAQGGSCAGMKNWFENSEKKDATGNVMPEKNQYAGAHFGIEKNGRITQFVDTKYIVYGAGSANDHAINVENVGQPGDDLTPDQVISNANLLAWCNKTHNIRIALNFYGPIYFTDAQIKRGVIPKEQYAPLNDGLGFHAQYGGHPYCPGPSIVAQLPRIVDVANEIISDIRGWEVKL
jgi:hypothetical protein